MKKVILYAATSLDGKIAKEDGDVEWLEDIPNPENLDYVYTDFYESKSYSTGTIGMTYQLNKKEE